MKLEIVKNIQFTRLVKSDGRLREFNFRKLNTAETGQFSIDVVDNRGERIIFRMQQTGSGWHIPPDITGLPQWISQEQSSLQAIIQQEWG